MSGYEVVLHGALSPFSAALRQSVFARCCSSRCWRGLWQLEDTSSSPLLSSTSSACSSPGAGGMNPEFHRFRLRIPLENGVFRAKRRFSGKIRAFSPISAGFTLATGGSGTSLAAPFFFLSQVVGAPVPEKNLSGAMSEGERTTNLTPNQNTNHERHARSTHQH